MIATKTCCCGQEIEYEAEFAREGCCPNCGAALVEERLVPSPPAKRKRTRLPWFGLAVIVALLAVCVIGPERIMDGCLKGVEKIGAARKAMERERAKRRLYVLATNEVTQRLKSPRTAVFDGPDAVSVNWGEHANYRSLRGYVDSQNGFGALVRMNWEVQISPSSDEVYRVKFDEQ